MITNGLFTLDVLVALLLCVLGYLIHWITSIRDRELLFGIYRAMGISMREVSRMLTLEQLFLSLGPVLAGIGAGSVATILFAKLFSRGLSAGEARGGTGHAYFRIGFPAAGTDHRRSHDPLLHHDTGRSYGG